MARRFLMSGGLGRFFGPGELRLALLALLSEQAGHGYDLMGRLEQRFDGAYQASAGSIYPTLQQLEDEGLVQVDATGGRKVFHLAEAGHSEVSARQAEIERLWSRAAWRGEWGALRDPHAAEIVGPALRLVKAAVKTIVHAHGDPRVADEVRMILTDARHSIERMDRRRKR